MKRLLLSVCEEESRLAVEENGVLVDYLAERADREDLVGRVYKGVVKNVVPAVKGFFVDLGIGRNAFLRQDGLSGTRKRPPTEGSVVTVQVVRDSISSKGPLVTEQVSLPGRYAVLLADSTYIGISKKIQSEEQREALRQAARAVCPGGMGVIIRTAAADVPVEDIQRDIARLASAWDVIGRRARVEKAPALLYRESELIIRTVRDFFSDGTSAIITDDRKVRDRLVRLMEEERVPQVDRILCEGGNLFARYHVMEQIEQLFQREVSLPSGGTLIFDYTEALTAIDVNSGAFHQKGMAHGDIAFLVNQEAAVEIARQIRMRGIGGMILIDFIDMDTAEQKEKVLGILRREARKDRVRTVVLGMTALGLVEMTRKRTVHELYRNYYEPCPCCGGKGYVPSASSIVLRIYRALNEEKEKGGIPRPLLIECHPDVAHILEGEKAQWYLKSTMLRPVRVKRRSDFQREVFSILSDNLSWQ